MNLNLRIILLFCTTLILNTTTFAASYNANETSTTATVIEGNNFKNKAKQFVEKHIIKNIKKQVKKIKDSWKGYKDRDKKAGFTTSFFLLLTAVFVTLKLTGVIAWSWLWVLAPLWIPLAMFILLFLVVLIGLSAASK